MRPRSHLRTNETRTPVRTSERLFVDLNKWVVIVLLAAMSLIVFANVTLRYLSNFSIVWAEEVSRYLMIWMTFMGAGLVLRHGGHVAITNLHDWVTPSVARRLRVCVALILFAFFAMMMWIGYDYMSRMGRQLTPATRLPFSYIYAAMPIGFLLLSIHLLLVIRSFVAGERIDHADGAEKHAAG